MDETKQNLTDARQLKKYPEFYALKKELEAFCQRMENIHDIDLQDPSRVSLEIEIYGRVWASEKVRELLSSLGLIDKSQPKVRDMTGE